MIINIIITRWDGSFSGDPISVFGLSHVSPKVGRNTDTTVKS